MAEDQYSQFVASGIGEETIWNDVKGKTILGKEDFVDSLVDHFNRHKHIPEISKSQRYANRPGLEKIFSEILPDDKRTRNEKIAEAVYEHGYTQRAVADYLGLHFSYVSRILYVHDKR